MVEIKSYTKRNKSRRRSALVFALKFPGLVRLVSMGTVGVGVCWVSVLSMSMLCMVTTETSIPFVIHYKTPGT